MSGRLRERQWGISGCPQRPAQDRLPWIGRIRHSFPVCAHACAGGVRSLRECSPRILTHGLLRIDRQRQFARMSDPISRLNNALEARSRIERGRNGQSVRWNW